MTLTFLGCTPEHLFCFTDQPLVLLTLCVYFLATEDTWLYPSAEYTLYPYRWLRVYFLSTAWTAYLYLCVFPWTTTTEDLELVLEFVRVTDELDF